MNWSRVQKSTTRNFGQLDNGFASLNITSSQDTVTPSWNAANFEFGQRVNFDEAKTVRFFGGVTYARLAADINRLQSGTIFGVLGSANVIRDSVFNGFGPRIGADMAYHFNNSLGMYADSAFGILAGSQGFEDSLILTTSPVVRVRDASINTVIPEFELKLGATYNRAIMNGQLSLDAGWMWIDYLNAVLSDKYRLGNSLLGVETSNFTLQGPFVGLKWTSNVV